MSSEARFWDKVSKKYAASPIKDMESYEYTLGRTRSYLNKNARVLELGCGTGSTAVQLAGDTGAYLGTDISSGMIEFANGKAKESGLDQLSFKVASTQDALDPSERRTHVLAFNILHLVRDVRGTLAAAHDVLEPGGLLISKTVCMGSAHLGFRLIMRIAIPVMQLFGKAPFVHSFTVPEFDKMIEDAGFEIIEVGNHPASPPSRYVVARKL